MRMLSWTLALAATCFFAVMTPATSATVVLTGTGIDYNVDPATGDGFAIGTVSDGVGTFDLEISAVFDPIDPANALGGSLLITAISTFDEYVGGLLEEIEIGSDYVTLLFGDLTGIASGMFGTKVRVVFTDFDWNEPIGLASVEIHTVAPVPLPATAVLLLSGMAGVTVMARRRTLA